MSDDKTIEQSISLYDRKSITITGVKDVLSFDEESVNLITELGNLILKGEKIKISGFDVATSVLEASGIFNAMVYLNDKNSREGFFKRLWR
jgi:sporulation protein YabP